ncbi:MAG: heavy metal-associated domain-containing protein, partial [Pseudomonadota bacterium]
MSEKREMKKIALDTLDDVDSKAGRRSIRKVALAVLACALAGGAAYGALRLLGGEVIASKFAVNQLTCSGCVVTVKDAAAKIPGVVDSDVSLAAQAVTITFKSRQTEPESIRKAIEAAGYPAKHEGRFHPTGEGVDQVVAATVNGRPVFATEMKLPLRRGGAQSKQSGPTDDLFSAVGREVLLQAADRSNIVVQPYEVEAEVLA